MTEVYIGGRGGMRGPLVYMSMVLLLISLSESVYPTYGYYIKLGKNCVASCGIVHNNLVDFILFIFYNTVVTEGCCRPE